MSGETILVTGGAGYIGSHCCKALSAAGYYPVVLDSLVYGHERAVQWGSHLSDLDSIIASARNWHQALPDG